MSVSLQEIKGPERFELKPQSGAAFRLRAGESLSVVDPRGQQVADLYCVDANDLNDALSSGRSIDYNESIRFTTGSKLYSNEGRVMMTIERDDCGVHDFLVTPCSLQMFRMIAKDDSIEHPSCQNNLVNAMKEFDVNRAVIGTTFNVFMNVPVLESGKIEVRTPISRAGDVTVFRAERDLIVGLTACSDPGSNGGSCKPIQYFISRR